MQRWRIVLMAAGFGGAGALAGTVLTAGAQATAAPPTRALIAPDERPDDRVGAGERGGRVVTAGEVAERRSAAAQEEGFGRPNPGRPEYRDPEFQGRATGGQTAFEVESGPERKLDSIEAGDEVYVDTGFFFDNFTSGSGFGVYGGEPTGNALPNQLTLRSAAQSARDLGLQLSPGQSPTLGGGEE